MLYHCTLGWSHGCRYVSLSKSAQGFITNRLCGNLMANQPPLHSGLLWGVFEQSRYIPRLAFQQHTYISHAILQCVSSSPQNDICQLKPVQHKSKQSFMWHRCQKEQKCYAPCNWGLLTTISDFFRHPLRGLSDSLTTLDYWNSPQKLPLTCPSLWQFNLVGEYS